MLAQLQALYVYDSLRGDGFPVRFSRLGMLAPQNVTVWALCWVMEVSFDVAYLVPRFRFLGIMAFWFAYLTILHVVLH